MLTGGGTGGHITPILAVAHELKQARPDIRLVYIGERKGRFADMMRGNQDIDEVYTIFAGKFRRYHGESWLKRLFAIKTNAQNIRDAVFVLIGLLQSYRLLGKIKPDTILLKGGFVGMPVGLAAAARKLPFVTHDSDILPGLANRTVSRWARYHATGMPAQYYKYPAEKVKHVGVLVMSDYQPVNPMQQKQFKIELGIQSSLKVLLVTGGSNGARAINLALVKTVPDLLCHFPDLYIVHQVGKGNSLTYGNFRHDRLRVLEFLEGMHRYTGAADMVITRAGANTLAELGVQGKACMVVPNPLLTGGHQVKNTEYLSQQDAIIAIDEKQLAKDADVIVKSVEILMRDTRRRQELAGKLQTLTIPDAAHRLALVLLETAA